MITYPEERMKICEQCPSFQSTLKLCKECGCLMAIKVLFKGTSCPLGKWKAV